MVSFGKPGPAGWIPWAIWTEYIFNDLFITHEGPYTEKEKASIIGWATTGAILFSIPAIVEKVGLGTIGWVLGIYYAGKWTSQLIDPDEGKDNFHGFISAGYYGNDPHYGSAQRPGSGGYFDIAGNLAIILQNRKRKKSNVETTYTQDLGWQSEMTKEMELELGFISVDEYVRWFNAEIAKMDKARDLKAKWNALSPSAQKDMIAVRTAFQRQRSAITW